MLLFPGIKGAGLAGLIYRSMACELGRGLRGGLLAACWDRNNAGIVQLSCVLCSAWERVAELLLSAISLQMNRGCPAGVSSVVSLHVGARCSGSHLSPPLGHPPAFLIYTNYNYQVRLMMISLLTIIFCEPFCMDLSPMLYFYIYFLGGTRLSLSTT